ncbi:MULTISPECIES: anti-sigma factor [unclassified Arthrobacter]|uniref:anti-sigma factor n=1 Tax=unclassified Arthrobacter TaxID=235627 RepID=UPI002DF96168|nr:MULTISPECIES: anti-sigma factor [unclassified Arthrobacter]MEC5191599.1 anti-sigma-K factor RskA [Arthrobacter sp. MP_M4]MEC5203107.1 anti-sigma-K factor RskA [Arthrobacter sp. MP_M7]
MTDTNAQNNGRVPGGFAADIATDLASGRAADLSEVYALNAVDDAERAAIEAHISVAPPAERAAFDERVRQTRETLAASFTVEEEPPAGLLDRILAALPAQDVAAAPDGQPGYGTPAAPPVVARPVRDPSGLSATDELGAARRRREERRRPQGMRNWLVGVAAAAAIAVGGVGVGAYVANQNDPLNQVLQANDVRRATVDVVGGGTATVSVSSSKDAIVVKMNDVPAPPAGKVYQMWLIPKDGSAPVSQGLMDAEALSKPAVVKGISTAAALGITVEPVGGSQSPTMPTVAAAPLNA